MAEFDFRLARGWDVFDPPNIEDLIGEAPFLLPDQFVPIHGGLRRVAFDSTIHRGGKINLYWGFPVITQTYFNVLLDTIFEGNPSGHVTLYTLTERGVYGLFNATAERPYPGVHYTHWIGGDIRDLVILFWNLRPCDFSFDSSFDDSFSGS